MNPKNVAIFGAICYNKYSILQEIIESYGKMSIGKK